ncbi:DUF636 domain protein (glutathione-dependent formaldehyde-activating enzyme) [Colletotrichum truncatum]|uniref:DUF636 domain protein (Glutathione-dependent formaldehyde-activating enzyme) n=1 Tax=Colletotrichum truncatum TaxID=5467 RepID=A0ACC3YUT8_COLTU|nr:DUF636 domain protein (glutathione-dependent formaldehyde-activating enzyme) [Colletotrichum truncatum]KAF6785874.1 DUF636 domain protein (glutathione-dependent formaldehyde-activating enzyme) [Colletotrichum truncatum]
MLYTGSCDCGAVKYRYEGEALAKAICHCIPCQKRSGSAFSVNIIANKSLFQILQGTTKTIDRVGDSGKPYHAHFCGDCGTTIYGEPESAPDMVSIKAGTLDTELSDLDAIDAEVYVVRRKTYLEPIAGVKQFDGMLSL